VLAVRLLTQQARPPAGSVTEDDDRQQTPVGKPPILQFSQLHRSLVSPSSGVKTKLKAGAQSPYPIVPTKTVSIFKRLNSYVNNFVVQKRDG